MTDANSGGRARQPAKKIYVRELLDSYLRVAEGLEPNAALTARGAVARASIIGVVIATEELPVSSLTIDDGTGQIQVRSFERKLPQTVGSVVQVIGRPRSYQGTHYLAAEAIAIVDAGWAEFRKKELGNVQTKEQEIVAAEERQSEGGENRAELILRLIRELDDGAGAPIEQVVVRSRFKDAEDIIEQMLLAGDIFELRPGKVKIL
jgi:RPA family protein